MSVMNKSTLRPDGAGIGSSSGPTEEQLNKLDPNRAAHTLEALHRSTSVRPPAIERAVIRTPENAMAIAAKASYSWGAPLELCRMIFLLEHRVAELERLLNGGQ